MNKEEYKNLACLYTDVRNTLEKRLTKFAKIASERKIYYNGYLEQNERAFPFVNKIKNYSLINVSIGTEKVYIEWKDNLLTNYFCLVPAEVIYLTDEEFNKFLIKLKNKIKRINKKETLKEIEFDKEEEAKWK